VGDKILQHHTFSHVELMYVSSVGWQKSDVSLQYSVIEITTAIVVGCQTGCSFRNMCWSSLGPVH